MILAGRTIVVTGGSRGIGRACVLSAVARGARVVFCSRQDGPESRRVEREATEIAGPGAAFGVAADVSNETDVARLFETAHNRCGDVNGVVNNAALSHEQLLVSMTTADWDAVIEANLTGGFLVAREAIQAFLAHGRGGRFVAIGTLSQFGVSGNAAYAVSKGGLAGLTEQIARQYGSTGIRAAMVIPGYVETDLSARMSETQKRALIDHCPMRRPGSPVEIAAVVCFLLSDAATGIGSRMVFATGGLREVPL